VAPRAGLESAFAEATAGQASNPPVNRQEPSDLPGVAEACGELPNREIKPVESGAIEDPTVAPVCGDKPRRDARKGKKKAM
jgi:hypothetical protein